MVLTRVRRVMGAAVLAASAFAAGCAVPAAPPGGSYVGHLRFDDRTDVAVLACTPTGGDVSGDLVVTEDLGTARDAQEVRFELWSGPVLVESQVFAGPFSTAGTSIEFQSSTLFAPDDCFQIEFHLDCSTPQFPTLSCSDGFGGGPRMSGDAYWI